MKLESRIEPAKNGGRPRFEIKYRGNWLTFTKIAKLEEFEGFKFTGPKLYNRWHRGKQTKKELLKPFHPYKPREIKEDESFLSEGLSAEEWEALKSGNNKLLMEL